MLYNKDNLGGFPMRKSKRVDLGLTITTAVFFVIAASLFFLLPTIDNAIAVNPSGIGYDPINLYINGYYSLLTLNFASRYYMVIFGTGCVIAVALIIWLILIIVKKQPKKLIFFFIIAAMAFASACLVSGYVLTPCRIVTLDNGVQVQQRVINDLLGKYSGMKDANGNTPLVLYNYLSMILGYVVLGAIGLVGIFSILVPIVGGCTAPNRRKLAKAQPAEEAKVEEQPVQEEKVEEPVETEEEAARRKEEERLIAYVEYKAGKPAREKQYEELCKAHGIGVEEEAEEVDDDEYYRITAAQLRCLHEQPVQEEVEEPVEDDEEYYRTTAAQLGCLHEEKVAPAKVDDSKYYEELVKDLPVFRSANVAQNLRLQRYYNEIIDELSSYKNVGEDNPEPLLRLRERAKEQKEYYEKLKKELACLQYQKDPVEPKIK